MKYTIELVDGYLRARMRERDSAEETREFVTAILEALKIHRVGRILISIEASRALFKVEDWKFSDAVEQAIRIANVQVAFVADSADVRMSQQYIALLGRQRGLRFEAFDAEPQAVAWLLG